MKVVLFMIGFVIGGALTYFILLAFLQDRGETWVPWVSGGAAVVVGILCGVLTICIYYIGIFLAGGSVGFLVAWFILAAIDIPFFQTHIYVPVIASIVLGLVVGIVALIIQKWFFMLGTAVIGAFKIAWGIDYYLELGSMVYYLLLFAEHRAELNPCWYSWCMIGLFVIVVVSGFLIQALLTGRKYDHKKDFKGERECVTGSEKCSDCLYVQRNYSRTGSAQIFSTFSFSSATFASMGCKAWTHVCHMLFRMSMCMCDHDVREP